VEIYIHTYTYIYIRDRERERERGESATRGSQSPGEWSVELTVRDGYGFTSSEDQQ